MSVTDSTSQLPAPIHTLSWPGQALPSFPFPGFIVPWYRSDTLWQHQRNSSSKASQDANPWFPCFEKASFQFSHEFLLLGDTASHCALAGHPDVHDNTAVLSQSRCALLRGEQVIPDGDGEHHMSRTFQQQIAKEVQEKEKAINNFLCQFIWSELIINGNAGKTVFHQSLSWWKMRWLKVHIKKKVDVSALFGASIFQEKCKKNLLHWLVFHLFILQRKWVTFF